MSRFAFWRSRRGVVALVAILLLGSGALAWALTGDDGAAPVASNQADPSTPDGQDGTDPTPTPSATPTESPDCEGPTTRFNVEGVQQDSLLPDCGEEPVTDQEQKFSGLGLGCGGSYPVILYKTTTAQSKSSICGVDASGQKLRVVVAPNGGPTLDLAGSYEYQLDAFVAVDGDTRYIVQAYDGSIVAERDGRTSTQESVDWISLDNESDGEVDPRDVQDDSSS